MLAHCVCRTAALFVAAWVVYAGVANNVQCPRHLNISYKRKRLLNEWWAELAAHTCGAARLSSYGILFKQALQ